MQCGLGRYFDLRYKLKNGLLCWLIKNFTEEIFHLLKSEDFFIEKYKQNFQFIIKFRYNFFDTGLYKIKGFHIT